MFKLRFWKVVFFSFFRIGNSFLSSLRFWVTPFDLDIYFHLNNAFYLKYMDLGRWDLILRAGVIKHLIKARIQPVVVRVEIDYKRTLNLGRFFVLKSQFVEFNEKNARIRQTFWIGDRIAADAYVTIVFLREGKVIPVSEVNAVMPEEVLQGLLMNQSSTLS